MFSEVIKKINKIADSEKYELRNFQSNRAEKYNRRISAYKFFNNNNSFVINNHYTYHFGGSNEFQFNISDEGDFEGQNIFRYGVAFSLQKSINTLNPTVDRLPEILRFNRFFKNNKNFFLGYKMWVFTKDVGRTSAYEVRAIKKSEIKEGKFIFIGKWINKSSSQINDNDINKIVGTLEELYPLYKYVQLKEPFSTEARYTRLIWNTNKWQTPTYHKWNKENYEDPNKMHEEKHGYGYEEWLFNSRYQLNGYQYGFIQGINRIKGTQDFLKELTLFTIDPENKKRYIVAKINNLEIIANNPHIQEEVRSLFKAWKNTMVDELKAIGADYSFFESEGFIPNVRFKNENTLIYEDKLEANFLKGNKFTRFNAYKIDSHPELLEGDSLGSTNDKFNPGEGRTSKGHKRKTKASTKAVTVFHSVITDCLRDYLIQTKKLSLEKDISVEKTRVDGGLIDVIVSKDGSKEIFEVKTRNTAKGNIREALGQVFEYSFYKNNWNVKKMIIVGPAKPNKKDIDYIKLLNKTIASDFKLEYWAFDNDKATNEKFIEYSN
ncbi:hypothetical protein [Pontimicrobium sp. MEBiC01747]